MAYSGPVFVAGKLPKIWLNYAKKKCYITIVHHETWWLWGGFPTSTHHVLCWHHEVSMTTSFHVIPKWCPPFGAGYPSYRCQRCRHHNLGHNSGYLCESPMVIILYHFPHWTYIKIIDLPVFHYAPFLDDCPYTSSPRKKKRTATAEVTERSRSSPAAARSRSNQNF